MRISFAQTHPEIMFYQSSGYHSQVKLKYKLTSCLVGTSGLQYLWKFNLSIIGDLKQGIPTAQLGVDFIDHSVNGGSRVVHQ
jgi:uncharacterized membrane protein